MAQDEIIVSAEDSSDEYNQEFPETNPNEKKKGPPILPPHLLQVILNKDTPVSVSSVDNGFE